MVGRGIALFLGMFSLLNCIGGLFKSGFDADPWWVRLAPLPGWLEMCSCLSWRWHCSRAPAGPWRRSRFGVGPRSSWGS